jgi:cytoskeletal protein CcmA (bactofilin family)
MPMPTESAVLDRQANFSGRVAGQDLLVLGTFDGDLDLSGRLRAGSGSRLRARVNAAIVELEGDFEGEVQAGTLRVASTARVRGVFKADRLAVQDGAVLEGAVESPRAAMAAEHVTEEPHAEAETPPVVLAADTASVDVATA